MTGVSEIRRLKHRSILYLCRFRVRQAVFIACIVSLGASVRAGTLKNSPVKAMYTSSRVRTIDLKGCGGEENWSSLTICPDGQVLAGMSSRAGNAVLISIDPQLGKWKRLADLGKTGHLKPFQRQPKIHVTPVLDSQGSYHFFSHFGQDTHLPLLGSRIGYEGMRRWRWDMKTGKTEDLGLIMRGEGAVALNLTADGRTLYVVSFPRALLLEIDSKSGKVRNLGRTNAVYAPRHVLMDPWDNPYVLDHQGRFWTVSKSKPFLHPLDARLLPNLRIPGNLLSQGLTAVVESKDRSTSLVMTAWGELYQIRFKAPGKLKIRDYGAPADRLERPDWNPPGQRMITTAGLALGPDGWLYFAISGYNRAVDKSGDSYIARCRRDGTDAEVVVRLDGDRISYICGSNAVDARNGRVFFLGNHLTVDSPYLIIIENREG